MMNVRDFGKVAVLFGGRSAEREVSLNSGSRVLAALRRQGVDAHAFDPAERQLDDLAGFARAFIALHGRYGEDGTIQGALELMGIPYTGSGVMASALGMDKWRTKLLWQAAGLPVPPYLMLDDATDLAAVEGGSRAATVCQAGLRRLVDRHSRKSNARVNWQRRAPKPPRHDSLVIAERAILGGEYTVAILGNQALPIIKIEPSNEFYDYEAKYLRDDTAYRCPCGLTETRESELRQQALDAFRVLGGRGWGRVDFLLDQAATAGGGAAYFLEVNTSPGMTDHSLVPMAARAAGMSYDDLVVRILALATLG
jgi:D-alanine-D-alanine ligase